MSKRADAPTDFTAALANELRSAVRDQWAKFPTRGDFNKAAAARAGVSDETIARILRAETSIRTDYLFHMATLLGMKASELLARAEESIDLVVTDPSGEVVMQGEVKRSADDTGEGEWDGSERRKDPGARAWFEENSGRDESDMHHGAQQG